MVFVGGGVSYAELRVAYDLMRKNSREVIIGGTHLLTPAGYLDELKTLESVAPKAKPEQVDDDEYETVRV
jgi:syntaxin-binding protein 1